MPISSTFPRLGAVAAILILGFGSIGCAHKPVVTYRYDAKTNFAAFKTYVVEPTNSPTLSMRMLDGKPMTQVLQESIEQQLNARGLKPAGSAPADLRVRWAAQIEYDQARADANSPGVNLSDDLSRPDSGAILDTGGSDSDVIPEQVSKGGVRIDLVNAQTSQVVWRGGVATVLHPNAPDPERVKKLNEALAELFKNYPPTKPSR